MSKPKALGILGGMGPMATSYFYELITAHTKANCDSDHINIIISSRATTPDRTAFILGKSKDDPLEVMLSDAKMLCRSGAEILAMPCNTAHYFYEKLASDIDVPLINIMYETVSHIKKLGVKKVGIMATEGTVLTGTYQNMCKRFSIDCEVPSEKMQKLITDIIYSDIKSGKRADMNNFNAAADELRSLGCNRIILGCTELSIVKKQEGLDSFFVDSLEALAYKTITACGKNTVGLDEFQ